MGLVAVEASEPGLLREVFAFRYRLFVDGQGLPPAGIDHDQKIAPDHLDQYSVSFALLNVGRVIGCLRLTCVADIPNPDILIQRLAMQSALARWGAKSVFTSSRFMFERPRLGRGMYLVIKKAYDVLFERNARVVFGDCSRSLLPFYKHMGYRTFAPEFVDPDFGIKVPLLLLPRDYEWLSLVNSPLTRLAAEKGPDIAVSDWFHAEYRAGRPDTRFERAQVD